jgi:hypothetical protein
MGVRGRSADIVNPFSDGLAPNVEVLDVTGPNTLGVVSTHSGYYFCRSQYARVLFGTLSKLYFQQNTSPYISHGTDTIMTPNDTSGIENRSHSSSVL